MTFCLTPVESVGDFSRGGGVYKVLRKTLDMICQVFHTDISNRLPKNFAQLVLIEILNFSKFFDVSENFVLP